MSEVDSNFGGKKLSELKFYSYAIVAKNKDLDSDLIEAVPTEDSGYLDGEITDDITKIEAQGTDKDNKSFKNTIESTASVEAKWLSFTDTNRMTSPDVRRGEEVVLWRFGDTDQYWWTTLKQDNKLRRLETVIYGYNNLSEENTAGDHTNMYWIEISTHRKHVTLHTAKNDKEPFMWDFQLDTKNGVFTIDDNDGGYFFYDAKNKHFKMKNKDESYFQIDKKTAYLYTLDKITIETNHFEVIAKQDIKMTTRDYSLTTSSYKVKAASWLTTVPTANFSSTVKSGGPMYNGGTNYAASQVPDRT